MNREINIRKVDNGYLLYGQYYTISENVFSTFDEVIEFLRQFFVEFKKDKE